MDTELQRREKAIHLLRSGHSVAEVARKSERSTDWMYKWRKRYEQSGWSGLQSQSKAPRKHGKSYSKRIRQVIIETRSELEAEKQWARN